MFTKEKVSQLLLCSIQDAKHSDILQGPFMFIVNCLEQVYTKLLNLVDSNC